MSAYNNLARMQRSVLRLSKRSTRYALVNTARARERLEKLITEVLPSINRRSIRMLIIWLFMTALAVILVRAFMIRVPNSLSLTFWGRRDGMALLLLWR